MGINPKKFKPLGMLSILPAKPSKHKAHDTNIDDPDKVKHTRHGYFDKEKQKFVGNFPDSFKLHLNKQFGVKPKQLPSRAVPGYKEKNSIGAHRPQSVTEEAWRVRSCWYLSSRTRRK